MRGLGDPGVLMHERERADADRQGVRCGHASLHLTERGMHRLARCAAEPCRSVFADVTRNGRQRYCSVRCANRDAVRRYRARTA